MITLNLTAKGTEQELIKKYLEENASEMLAEKINNGVKVEKDGKTLINKKSLDGFMKYATDEAKKLAEKGASSACVRSDVVFGWSIRIDEANTKRMENDKKERAEFYEKFNAVAEKYLPMQKDKNATYLVIIAKSPAELKAEGKALHHCVGSMGYEQKFAREETLIFFIRSADAPDVSLVTMEYSLKSKKILQCYAYGNTKPADDITTYINTKWLPYAKRQLKKIAA